MPNDSLIDKDGIVHEKGWDGQYHPKQGLFGPERDTDLFGHPNAERDWLGNLKEERDWLGRPAQSSSGEALYRRSGDSYSSSSSSGAEVFLALLLFILVLVVALIGVVIAATPILAPIFLSFAASAERRGDIAEAKKWRARGELASIVALMVVLGIAGVIGLFIFSAIASFVQSTTPSIVASLIYLIAAGIGIVAAVLSGITGLAPTAIVYLRQKETQLRSSGKLQVATRVRQLAWGFGIVAAGTTGLVILGFGILMVGAVVISFIRA